MTFKWPWVSRLAYDNLVEQLQRVTAERDSYRDRGDRLYDETILRFGYEPASPKVREEMKQEIDEQLAALVIEDPTAAMIEDEIAEIEKTVDAAVDAASKQKPS